MQRWRLAGFHKQHELTAAQRDVVHRLDHGLMHIAAGQTLGMNTLCDLPKTNHSKKEDFEKRQSSWNCNSITGSTGALEFECQHETAESMKACRLAKLFLSSRSPPRCHLHINFNMPWLIYMQLRISQFECCHWNQGSSQIYTGNATGCLLICLLLVRLN